MDVRYNEMWKAAWDDRASEIEDYSTPLSKQYLVLSWKQLSVTVKKKTTTFFGRSEIVYKQILDNGKSNFQLAICELH